MTRLCCSAFLRSPSTYVRSYSHSFISTCRTSTRNCPPPSPHPSAVHWVYCRYLSPPCRIGAETKHQKRNDVSVRTVMVYLPRSGNNSSQLVLDSGILEWITNWVWTHHTNTAQRGIFIIVLIIVYCIDHILSPCIDCFFCTLYQKFEYALFIKK